METTSDSYGRFKLKPEQSRLRKFLMILAMAIVWNALTGLAIFAVTTNWKGGAMYIVAVVLFVFALLGLLLIYASVYQLISLFGPRAKLTTGSNEHRFGGRLDLNWSFTMPQLVKKLEFWVNLESKPSDGACVYNVSDPSMAGRGQASIQLPERQPGKKYYVLKIKATIKYLPDLDEDYPLNLS